ncbi:hypothetical protein L3Q82_019298, partial [Scortum barcoo]
MSHREEASGKTQDTLERLCLSAGLGTPRRIPPEELEEVSGVREGLGISAQTAASATRSRTKRMKMDGWMDVQVLKHLYPSLGCLARALGSSLTSHNTTS